MSAELCPGSGEDQVVDWPPEADGYPGASVCIGCSFGILLKKNSIHDGISQSGHEASFGTLKKHYVKMEWNPQQRRNEPGSITYKKPKVKED